MAKMTKHCVDLLNRFLENDKDALQDLVEHRVKVNDRIADDTHILCSTDNEVGVLGIINGILSECNSDIIQAVYDDNDNIIEFRPSRSSIEKSLDDLYDNYNSQKQYDVNKMRDDVLSVVTDLSIGKHIDYINNILDKYGLFCVDHNKVITRDYRYNRIQVVVDENNVIIEVKIIG